MAKAKRRTVGPRVHQDRPSGPWKYYFCLGGKRYRKSGFASKQEAEDAMWPAHEEARRRARSWKAGKLITDHQLTAAIRMRSIASIREKVAAGSTEERAKANVTIETRFVDRFAEFVGKDRRLSEITADHVQEWVDKLTRDDELSANSVRRYHSAVSSFFTWLCRRRYLRRSPARDTILPKHTIEKKDGLTLEQVGVLFDLVKDHRTLYRVYLLAFGAALRLGEIANARWEHVDLQARTIYVPKGKTDRSRSTLPIVSEKLLEWLKANDKKEGPIVTSRSAKAYPPDSLTRCRTLYSEKLAGDPAKKDQLQKLPEGKLPGFHLGRHTTATTMLRNGVRPEVAAAMLRHTTARTMETFYGHIVPVAQRAEVEGKLGF